MTIRTIPEIVSKGYCTGCGICASVLGEGKVRMQISSEGNMRPHVVAQISSGESAQVHAICPGVTLQHESSQTGSDPIWGVLHTVRTGHALTADVRNVGSSGGVLSAIALHLLENAKVDFVAQIAASATDPLMNVMQLSRSREDVLHAAGSRYGPSAPLARLDEMLESGQTFALIGKPCDVAAVRRLSLTDKRVLSQVRYLLSFMCAGVPSVVGTHELIRELGVDLSELKSFRYRGNGWPGMATAVAKDDRVAEMDYAKSWGTILNRHLQFRCKICPDGTGEFADVVCADAWYGKDGYPDFEEREGRSLVIARTASGEDLIQDAVKAGAIAVSDLDPREISRMQPYQLSRKQFLLGRLLATRLRLGWAPRYRNLNLLKASLTANPVDWLRNTIGTFRRAKGEGR
jgi:coenzyme F420 hydrogenase subunit beta